MTIMIILSIIGGFAIGAFLGFAFAIAFKLSIIAYHSKRECRECLRTRVEYGFYVDGKEYECVEKGELKK